MPAPSIHVEGVGKGFTRYRADPPATLKQVLRRRRRRRHDDRFWALRDVSFEVGPGEMLGVIGRNGAGKSTLLRIIGGVMRPDEGRVEVRGRIGGLLQLGVGFHSDLTGRENVYTNGIIAGLTRQEVAQRLDSIISFAELEDFIDSPLRTYSTGMRMRLGFATAVHTDPDVLLIDEVLTVGDLAFQQKCLKRIEEYKARGCAIAFVSHSLEAVQAHCERTLWLHNGTVAALGPSEIAVAEYRSQMRTETRRRMPVDVDVRKVRGGVELIMNENRIGSLDMEIEDVRLLDSAGRETSEIETGDPLSVEITYHAPKPIESPIFAVSIATPDDVAATDVNTANSGLIMPTVRGRGQIALHFERLDLSDNSYFVNVGAYHADWTFTYDHHWGVYPLVVHGTRKSSAVMSPPCRWELQAEVRRRRLV